MYSASKQSLPITLTSADAAATGSPAALLAELDIDDPHSLLFFGSRAQDDLTKISESMLEHVRAKDLGQAGNVLNEMVLTLRGFDLGDLDPERKPGLLDRILGRSRGAAAVLQRYETVRDQIDAVTSRLERHQTELLIDIEKLDRLYQANLMHLQHLDAYIAAGEAKLREMDQDTIPRRAHEAELAGNALNAQQLRDLRSARDDLDRRLHDLRLTRQVTLQALPGIRLVQDNDKALVGKIDSTLVNTVPLWRQQLAQALTIRRAHDAADSVAAANDLTNELLRANAHGLRAANRTTRQQIERGVFDLEAVAEANRTLIEAIEDSLRITDEGRAARSHAIAELDQLEGQLRQALAAASARELASVATPHPESSRTRPASAGDVSA
ncbi:MAG: toxic anion resistance protein [Gammaproteobacteria bacterium]|nr:toxic anion resistance protein [Gammaproteobacteria bacterium]